MIAAGAVGLAAAAGPAAEAASISNVTVSTGERFLIVLDPSLSVGGTPQANNASVAVENGLVVIRDTAGITIEPQGPTGRCSLVSSIEARCPVADRINFHLGGGNDRMEYRAPHEGSVSLGDGSDTLFAGRREAAGRQVEPVTYSGGFGKDTVTYVRADRRVEVALDDAGEPLTFDDGRAGDLEGVSTDVEVIEGSNFNDVLIGSDRGEVFRPLDGDDVVAALGGDDFIDGGAAPDGADTLGGGPGTGDRIGYGSRASGVSVSLDSVRNDGAPGEQDNIGGSVEHIFGTNSRDVLIGNGQANEIDGFGGSDTIDGLAGNDTLSAGGGNNGIVGGAGNDVLLARNGEIDNVDCGTETDTLDRDTSENRVTGCERVQVGVLRLTPFVVQAEAGRLARLRMSWRHPVGWRKLREVELRLSDDGRTVGTVTVRPRGQRRLSADGAVAVVRKRSALRRAGRAVHASLRLRLDGGLEGRTLDAEVEATDVRGRRQLERRAGTIRVSG